MESTFNNINMVQAYSNFYTKCHIGLSPYIPIIFTLCKAYSLALDDNTIHILGVLLLTSAHALFPIFIIQIHSKYLITYWIGANIIGNIFYATLHNVIEAIPIYIIVGIHYGFWHWNYNYTTYPLQDMFHI